MATAESFILTLGSFFSFSLFLAFPVLDQDLYVLVIEASQGFYVSESEEETVCEEAWLQEIERERDKVKWDENHQLYIRPSIQGIFESRRYSTLFLQVQARSAGPSRPKSGGKSC